MAVTMTQEAGVAEKKYNTSKLQRSGSSFLFGGIAHLAENILLHGMEMSRSSVPAAVAPRRVRSFRAGVTARAGTDGYESIHRNTLRGAVLVWVGNRQIRNGRGSDFRLGGAFIHR
jgi:hypothetical protein